MMTSHWCQTLQTQRQPFYVFTGGINHNGHFEQVDEYSLNSSNAIHEALVHNTLFDHATRTSLWWDGMLVITMTAYLPRQKKGQNTGQLVHRKQTTPKTTFVRKKKGCGKPWKNDENRRQLSSEANYTPVGWIFLQATGYHLSKNLGVFLEAFFVAIILRNSIQRGWIILQGQHKYLQPFIKTPRLNIHDTNIGQ